jgi:proteasome accessory factor C
VVLEPAARWVAEYYPTESVEEVGDGRLRVRMRVADPGWMTRLLLRLGTAAAVVEPAALAHEVRRMAAEALANYS